VSGPSSAPGSGRAARGLESRAAVGRSASRNLSGVALRTIPAGPRSPLDQVPVLAALKSSLMPRSPAAPRAAPMIPPARRSCGATGPGTAAAISVPPNRRLGAQRPGVWTGGRDVATFPSGRGGLGPASSSRQVSHLQLYELGPTSRPWSRPGTIMIRSLSRCASSLRHQGVPIVFPRWRRPAPPRPRLGRASPSLIECTCP